MTQLLEAQPEPTRRRAKLRPIRRGVLLGRRTLGEWVIESLIFLAGLSSVLITTGIVGVLVFETVRFFGMHARVSVMASGDVMAERQAAAALERQLDVLARGAPGAAALEARLAAHRQAIDRLEAEQARLKDLIERLDGSGVGFDATSLEVRGDRYWVFPDRAAFDRARAALGAAGFTVDDAASRRWRVTAGEFLTGTTWTPGFANRRFGILALVSGTLVTTLVALLVAIPAGTMIAVYLSEYAPHALRETLKPVLELLSAVPTVVYGYFALLFVTPLLQKALPGLPLFNMLSAGLVMGVMIIPYISSLSEDAMHAVPMTMREGSYAMGATRMQTAFRVVVPSAFSGITAAYILGISRAVGETMVVAVAAGQGPNFTFNPMEGAATITAYIVAVSKGDLPHASIEYQTIFAAGLTLLLMTLFFNVGGYLLRKRYRQAY